MVCILAFLPSGMNPCRQVLSACHPQTLLCEADVLSSCLALPRTAMTPWLGHRLCSKGRLSPAGFHQSAAAPCSDQASGRGNPKEAPSIPQCGGEGRKKRSPPLIFAVPVSAENLALIPLFIFLRDCLHTDKSHS